MNARRSPQEIGLAHLLNQIANRSSQTWPSRTAARFAGPIARKRPPMPAQDGVRLQDAQPAPPARPETGQHNPEQAVRLPKAETTWRALLQDGDLMAESHDLSLLSGAGPKCRGDQGQKSYEKWSHRGNHDDLTNRVKTCIFNPDGVFGIHRIPTTMYLMGNLAYNCGYGAYISAAAIGHIARGTIIDRNSIYGCYIGVAVQSGTPYSGSVEQTTISNNT